MSKLVDSIARLERALRVKQAALIIAKTELERLQALGVPRASTSTALSTVRTAIAVSGR